MKDPLQIGAFGMVAQQTRVDVIANNLANMNTTGYQQRRAEFSDLIYSNKDRPGSFESRATGPVPAGVSLGHGVAVASVSRVMEQGHLKPTGNDLDLAITGEGYFPVQLPNGETAYTRSGNFQLGPNGEMVTQDGYRLQAGITLPSDTRAVTVNSTGEVQVLAGAATEPQILGQLQLARFVNENGLNAVGDNLFLETEQSGVATLGNPGAPGFGRLDQGFLESSNVNPVAEISRMISAMRAYEMNSKVVQTADQMMGPPPNR